MSAADPIESFPFDSNDAWKTHFANLEFTVPPDATQMLRLKRKWYRHNVDATYQAPESAAAKAPPSSAPSATDSTPTTPSYQEPPKPRAADVPASDARVDSDNLVERAKSFAQRNSAYLVRWTLHLTSFVLAVNFILSELFGNDSDSAYTWSLRANSVVYLMMLYKTHGTPKMSQEFMYRVQNDPNWFCFQLSFIFQFANASYIFLMPLGLFGVYHVVAGLKSIAKVSRKSLLIQAVDRIDGFLTPRRPAALAFNGRLELAILFVSIFRVLTGHERIFFPFVYGMQLVGHYWLDHPFRQAVADLKSVTDRYIGEQPFVPQLIKNVYFKIVQLLSRVGAGPARTS